MHLRRFLNAFSLNAQPWFQTSLKMACQILFTRSVFFSKLIYVTALELLFITFKPGSRAVLLACSIITAPCTEFFDK